MIKSFHDKDTEVLFDDRLVRRFQSFERPARRKLMYLHRVRTLQELYRLQIKDEIKAARIEATKAYSFVR